MPELIWEGKYDEKKRKVAPLRVALPFQTVETVNESADERSRQLNLLASGRKTAWRNRLIWGDKKYVLPSLLDKFAGEVNLIYIDPPFATGADFSFTARIPDNPETEEDESAQFTKQPSMLEHKAYRDTWGKGLDSYLKWFYETAVFLRELLAENGSIYVHIGWDISIFIAQIMNEVFTKEYLQNLIIYNFGKFHASKDRWRRDYDVILFYTKGQYWTFNHDEVLDSYLEKTQIRFDRIDENGNRYKIVKGRKVYMKEGTTPSSVWRMSNLQLNSREYIGFPTQKTEEVLTKIIKASSNEGDLVLDCFCGSGTTAAVAEKLGRRWITADLSRFAIHTTRKRLLQIPNVRPFIIQNLGKYERQVWQSAEFGEENARRQAAYRKFILELYHAEPISGFNWLHGVKAGRMVHVGSVDSPVTESDLANIAAEFKKAMGGGENAPASNGVDILGWDFAFEVNEVAKKRAEMAGLNVRLKKIPMDVMDKRAVDQGDVYFFELAALEVNPRIEGGKLTVELSNFIIPQDDVPEEVRGKITHWSQWIDYWAVDWDFKEDTFHNQWQSYRTRKNNQLLLKTNHTYEAPGKYAVVIKVVDILGNDTTKMIQVEVK